MPYKHAKPIWTVVLDFMINYQLIHEQIMYAQYELFAFNHVNSLFIDSPKASVWTFFKLGMQATIFNFG